MDGYDGKFMIIDLDFMNILPQSLLSRGIFLRDKIGVYEIGWKFDDVVKVLDVIKEKEMTVLGGDVYGLNGYEVIITYDSWSFSGSNFIKSFEKASKYINNYYKNNGDNFIYTLIVSNATK
ncbi:Imm40 family immunity protein [uncultured Campylobacter sp.]|uniref:Imm40 family immunity protein n=1 Tax=uncultured Campylobacter sp. TaxID=218934 RepID=UPI002636E012|nr:Imm40 family immunity protein [uncultured Campylobacter sp.]